MVEFVGASGKKIVINPAPAADAFALKNAIHAKFYIPKINLDELKKGKGNVSDKIKDMDVSEILSGLAGNLLALDSDKDVNAALMACLVRCTYDSEKIVLGTFDDVEVREDYYEIIENCIRINLFPFYKGLISKWKALLQKFLKSNPL